MEQAPEAVSSPAEGTDAGPSPWLTLVIVLSAAFMELIDISIVNVAIPSIQQELSASYSSIEFIIAGYQLGFACVIITAARMGDIYGRKRMFLIGMVVFTLASLASGAATGITMLVAARVIQGIASGIMFPQVLSTIQVAFPAEDRGKAFAVFGAVVGLAAITGPLAGGALIAWDPFGLDWRSIFLVNVPIGVAAIVAAVFIVAESRNDDAERVDWPGTVLVSLGLFLLVYPLVEGRQSGWPWWFFVMMGLSVVVLTVFALYELKRTRSSNSPLIWMTLFRQRAFSAGNAVALVFFSGLGAFFFILTLTLQLGFAYSPLHAGLTVLPFAIGAALASGFSDVLAKRFGVRLLNAGALLLVVGMSWLLWLVSQHRVSLSTFDITLPLLVAGLGLGSVIAPLSDLIVSKVSGDETGSASGVLTAAQRIGGSVGIAVVGVIFFWQISASAGAALNAVNPDLRNAAEDAGLPTPVAEKVVSGFDECFRARSESADPASNPPECRSLREQARNAPVPEDVARRLQGAIVDDATPAALSRTFSMALEHTLYYEIAVFALVFLLCFLLPRGSDP